jgi:hypothetical protein
MIINNLLEIIDDHLVSQEKKCLGNYFMARILKSYTLSNHKWLM